MDDRIPTKLGKIVKFTSGGTPSLNVDSFWNGDIPWISASSMKQTRLVSSDRMITQDGLDNGSRLALKSSVLLLVRGSELHHRIPIGIAMKDLAFNQDIKSLMAEEGVIPEYLLYWLLGNEDLLMSMVEYTGIGAGKLDTDLLKEMEFEKPSLIEQQVIVHILGTLDDKIEINRRMNETLECIARALFKSWFIDFDPVRAKAEGRRPFGMDEETAALFPDQFEDSELGEIPKGWRITSISEHATIDKGLSYKGAGLRDAGTPLINLGCFRDRGGFVESGLKWYDGEYKSRHTIEPGDLVIANTDITQRREVLGSPAIVPEYWTFNPILFTHHVFALRMTTNLPKSFIYNQLQQPGYRERVQGFATGTTVLALPRDALLEYDFVQPTSAILQRFDAILDKIGQRVSMTEIQHKSLARCRDALLSRLISGDIRVNPSKFGFGPEGEKVGEV